ncbi:MAG: hypothetical protein ACR2M1_07655 [Gemmatimonadaceae bacterium]
MSSRMKGDMSGQSSGRKGWWRLFIPGAGMPTSIDERLEALAPVGRGRDRRHVNPLGTDVDEVLAEDPALWTDEDHRTVKAAHATIARDVREISAAGVLPPDTLRRAYHQMLRWLLVPVAGLVVLRLWGHFVPPFIVGTLRVLSEVALAVIAVGLLVMSRGFRFHELTAAATVASAADDRGGAGERENAAPRRLIDTARVVGSPRPRFTIRAVVEPPDPGL